MKLAGVVGTGNTSATNGFSNQNICHKHIIKCEGIDRDIQLFTCNWGWSIRHWQNVLTNPVNFTKRIKVVLVGSGYTSNILRVHSPKKKSTQDNTRVAGKK